MTCQTVIIWVYLKRSVCSLQPNIQAVGPTLRRDSVFVRTPGQAAVVRVQTRHMTGPVAARRRTFALLLVPPGRVWKGHRDEVVLLQQVISGDGCFLALKDQMWTISGPYMVPDLANSLVVDLTHISELFKFQVLYNYWLVRGNQVTTSGYEKWIQCLSALNLHCFYWPAGGDSTGCKKKSNCIEENEPTSHLIYYLSKWFQMILWS